MLKRLEQFEVNTLYLVGNGFDIFHGLPTRYTDFHKYIQTHHIDLESRLDDFFRFRLNSHYCWTNFEEDLGTFDWRSFFNDCNNVDPLDEDFRPSFIYSLEDSISAEVHDLIAEIRVAFYNWICSIDIGAAQRILHFQKNSFFINFNYTHTLEKVYLVKPHQILHIHGDADYNAEDLILGHNITPEEEPDFDEDGNSSRTLFTDAEDGAKSLLSIFKKPVQETISKHEQIFTDISSVKSVCILGHSLNLIDIPYTRKIFEKTSNVIWQVSYYEDEDVAAFKSTLVGEGIPSERINFFKLTDGLPANALN